MFNPISYTRPFSLVSPALPVDLYVCFLSDFPLSAVNQSLLFLTYIGLKEKHLSRCKNYVGACFGGSFWLLY